MRSLLPGLDTPEQLGPSAGLPGPMVPSGWLEEVEGAGLEAPGMSGVRQTLDGQGSLSQPGGWGAEQGGRPRFLSCGILFKPHHLPEPRFPNLLKGMLSKALNL